MGKKNPPVTFMNGDLQPSSLDANGNIHSGSGNTGHNYNGERIVATGEETAQKIHFRQGDDILSLFHEKDTFYFEVPSGPQVADPSHHVPGPNANRGVWNADISINYGHDFTASDLKKTSVTMTYDFNGVHDKFVFRAIDDGAGHVDLYDKKHGAYMLTDLGGDGHSMLQDSFNPAFVASFLDTDKSTAGIQAYHFEAGAEFDIHVKAPHTDSHTHLSVVDHSLFFV